MILGRDPYSRPKQAHGLAFSVPNGVAIPRSLKTICTNLGNDPAMQISRPHNGDLTSWAKTSEERFEGVTLSEANDFLTSHQLEPVTWDLPAAL